MRSASHAPKRLAILGVIWFALQMIEDALGRCSAYVTRAVNNIFDQIDPGGSPMSRMVSF
jgi:hypothetical protein